MNSSSKIRTLRFSFVLFFVVHAFCTTSGFAQWIVPPTPLQKQQTPGLVHETLESAKMRAKVGFSVVLPASYDNGNRRYPVVYWLHGGGGNECSSLFTASDWVNAGNDHEVLDTIIVYPNGFRSGYMDHHDGKVMVESMIIRELIPRIDARYRTIASANGRAVHGFSMGASGALKFAIKYPNMFCSAVAYGGGAIDLENDKSQFIRKILKRNLNSDPALIRANNSYALLEKHEGQLRQNDVRFLLICGGDDSWKRSAEQFYEVLNSRSLASELKIAPGIGHDPRGLIGAVGRHAVLFQDSVFRARMTVPAKIK